jgi:hypothetical protein
MAQKQLFANDDDDDDDGGGGGGVYIYGFVPNMLQRQYGKQRRPQLVILYTNPLPFRGPWKKLRSRVPRRLVSKSGSVPAYGARAAGSIQQGTTSQ